jgi:tRNA pseudouridine55 synthase
MSHASIDETLSGVLAVDKAAGMTSHDVVGLVRRAFKPVKIKVGHAGTLDPDATGLLLVCIGGATRVADLLADQGKVYRTEFVLGAATSTEDSSGAIVSETSAASVTEREVSGVLETMVGHVDQIPPMVSAVHHEGRRLYELARQGIEVERAPRRIRIDRIELARFEPGERATGEMVVECGKGAYVRTLCADLGARLAVGGHMSALRRLRIGAFDLAGALPVGELSCESVIAHLVAPSEAASFLPRRIVEGGGPREIAAGDIQGADHPSHWIRVVSAGGELLALATRGETGAVLQPKKVLVKLPAAL